MAFELFIEALEVLFKKQYGELPVGGFLNPTLEHITDEKIVFRCFYNNYDNECDCWRYEYERETGNFESA